MLSNTIVVPRILLVDDDAEERRRLAQALENADFEVWRARSGHDALEFLFRWRALPHLALVASSAAGMEGFAFPRRLRRLGPVPIILRAATDDENLIVAALEQFADDVVRTPVRLKEVVARVGRVLRRVPSFAYVHNPLPFINASRYLDPSRPLQFDFSGRQVIYHGQAVALTPTEMRLLTILLDNPGRYVSAHRLTANLWPDEAAGEDRLHTHVSRLRRKLEARPAEPEVLLSERGMGYTLAIGEELGISRRSRMIRDARPAR